MISSGFAEGILLVDDERPVRELVREMLRSSGYRLREAASAEEALVLFERGFTCELIIADYLLPGLNGGQLAETLQAFDPTLKVLLCSGNLGAEAVAARERFPLTQFLEKPFTQAELHTKVRNLLDAPRESPHAVTLDGAEPLRPSPTAQPVQSTRRAEGAARC